MTHFKILWQLFLIFFKIGSFTFGGGLAMIPLIQREVVEKQKWIEEKEILDIFAVAQSAPGVIAVNSSIFVGKKVAGFSGAVAAVLGTVLPAFISIIIILLLLTGLSDNSYVDKFFSGIKAASAALILLSALKLGKQAIINKKGYLIALISFLIIILFNLNAVWAVIFGGTAGYLIFLGDDKRSKHNDCKH